MIKALFKKQMLEVFAWIYRDRKTGKNRSVRGIIGYGLLNLFVFGYLGFLFYTMASSLCAPLAESNLSWLYIALMGLVALTLGVFGSVFTTYSSLYQAKDNDLLLSMPIPPYAVLATRLSGVYAIGLLYELVVMIPTVFVFLTTVKLTWTGVLFTLLIPLILSVLALTISCLLGLLVAFIAGKLKNAKIVTVFLSLAFIAGYYIIFAKASDILQSILSHPEVLAGKIRGILFPLYHMGRAAEGHPVSMLIFTGFAALIFGAVYLLLSFSFLQLATASRGSRKIRYREKRLKAGNIGGALLRKECRRFTGSTAYMLNCGLGTVLMIAATVAMLIKAQWINAFLEPLREITADILPLILTAALCMMVTMNDITAPSISLEGNNLWILKMMPVTSWQILTAKLKLHLLLTVPPALLMTAAALTVFKPSLTDCLFILAAVICFVLVTSLIGLFLGLKMPNLHWTNETVPIKQSLPVILSLFGGWCLVLALAGMYAFLSRWVKPTVYLGAVCILMAGLSALLFLWLHRKGTKLFDEL